MAIVVIGAVFVDVKGFPEDLYLPTGRNAGRSSLSTAAWVGTLPRISPMSSCGPPS